MKRRTGPWQRSLLVTCALSAAFVAASLLWQSGYPQWAFVVAFLTTWITLSVAWSDVDYTEESGMVLAQIVDHNFDRLHERLEELERQLEDLRMLSETPKQRAS
jgi:4-hydroxybenzoate polyprenyltransferase